ncbi:putative bifunctional diguanylate cyclase/phosphodiesterase [Flavisphingomonas formosensis]|uniref:putative bifunctional diguanylate cyclase/phosphodiesterase n=1 Tax=Flavisphingomonas formosensis TaxID=861534 RepID=UPI0018DFB4CF|nr:EAL domain-containing protein [Sphingomonas formosensis]
MSNEPEVILAQYREITRQIPLLYSLLIVNTAAVAFTHRGFAPPFLTYVVPAGLCAVSLFRVAKWLLPRNAPLDVTRARAQLKRSIFFAGAFSLCAVLWSLSLAPYGGPYEQGHVSLYISITVIACIFCLMHLPQAALLSCVMVTGPFITYYFLQHSLVWKAIALNIGLVSLVMIRVLLNSFRGFVELVRSQRDMAIKGAETERLSAENARLAMTDSLTGLPNRRFFFARLEEAIAAARRSGRRFAIGVLDLDRFKPINDTYGHVFGDRLLEQVGRRLTTAASTDALLARLGGDEFGVILFGGCDQAEAIGTELCELVSRPYKLDDMQVAIGCSAGFAIFPDAGGTAHILFDRSDYALYHSKSQKRGRCVLFSVEHETKIRSERAIEVALQAADLDAELCVHVQPIVDLQTMQVSSVEALARWRSPAMGDVPPDKFIAAAERFGMMQKVTQLLFGKALDALHSLPPELRLSFNLSAHDIVSQEIVDHLIAEMQRRGVSPRRIIFELTETALMRDFDLAVAGIDRLRAAGSPIALDDFGTGYSSLSYLRRLPIDKVKVDRSFLSGGNGSDEDVLAAIKGLCDNLRLRCVVEGIETASQLALVRRLGYDYGQGYVLGRPVSAASFRIDDAMISLDAPEPTARETAMPQLAARGVARRVRAKG